MDEQKPRSYEFGEFRLDTSKRLLLRGGEPVALTPKVFDTLIYLVENDGRVLTKDELMLAIWPETVVEENNLGQNISRLRSVLGENRGENRYIATVPGRGYRFVANVKPSLHESETQRSESQPLETVDALEPVALAGPTKRKHPFKWLGGHTGTLVVASALVVGLGVGASYLWSARKGTTAGSPIRSVAILPFKPLVPENRDEPLELGVADALITKLSITREIVVLPISSVRRYAGVEMDLVAVGRELGVEAVLDGTIQRSGDRIRVSARLVKVDDGRTLWAGQFDGTFGDIFAVQDSISERVVGELAVRLTNQEREFLAKRYTADPDAYELYLKGRFFWSKATRDGTAQATGYFQQALERDPGYALAYAGVADCYRVLPIQSDVPSTEAFPLAKAAALQALDIDEQLAEAHTSLGWIKFFFDWDWSGAEREFRRALEINPNDSMAHLGYAHLLSNLGRHEEALAEVDRAIRLEPLSPFFGALKGQFLFHARRYQEGIDHMNRVLEVEPNFWIGQLMLGKNLERAGRPEEALEAFRRARESSGGSSKAISLTGYTYAVSGRRKEAERALDELKTLSKQRYVPPYTVAYVYLGLADSDEAMRWLEKAYEEKDVHMVFLGADPTWDALRKDPRFVNLTKRVDLVE